MIVYCTELADPTDQLAGWGLQVVMDGLREAGIPVEYVPLSSPGKMPHPDVWLVSLPYAGNMSHLAEWLKWSRAKESGALLVLGGHGVINSTPFLDVFDAVFVGEADDQLAAIADALPDIDAIAMIPGMDTGTGEVWFQTATSLDLRKPYVSQGTKEGVGATTYLEIARGCKAKCKFCEIGWVYGYTERSRAATERMATPDTVYSAPDTDGVSWFSDAVSEGAYNPRWRSTRVHTYLRQPQTPKTGGRGRIRFGVEGITERLRLETGKPVTDAQIEQAMQRAIEEGYRMMRVFLIAGLPGETAVDRMGLDKLFGIISRLRGVRHWKSIDVKITGLSPQPHTPYQRLGIGGALDGIAHYRRLRRMAVGAKGRHHIHWRQVIIDRHTTEADVVKHMFAGALFRYLGVRENKPASQRLVERWARSAQIDYDRIIDGYGPSDELPWARVRHTNEARVNRVAGS